MVSDPVVLSWVLALRAYGDSRDMVGFLLGTKGSPVFQKQLMKLQAIQE